VRGLSGQCADVQSLWSLMVVGMAAMVRVRARLATGGLSEHVTHGDNMKVGIGESPIQRLEKLLKSALEWTLAMKAKVRQD
jgi:hypothetical protein